MEKPNVRNIVSMTAIFSFLGLLILFDQNNIDRDFTRLNNLIRETNLQALFSKESYELSFKNTTAILVNRTTKKVEQKLRVPTFYKINYETTEGNEKVIFTPRGTGPYNILLHGGEIILKSWFGRERTLWIHCTSYVTEGKMSDRSPNEIRGQ